MNPSRTQITGLFFGMALMLFVQAASHAAEAPSDVIALSQQVAAMQMLHSLDANAEQVDAIKALAPQTVGPAPQAGTTKVSAKYMKALQAVRAALTKPDNDDQLTDAQDNLEEISDAEDVDLDDAVEMTPAARAAAPAMVSRFSASQILDYFGSLEDDAPDLDKTVTDALDDVRDADAADAESYIKDDAEDAGILVAGLDMEKSAELRKQISDILGASRKLSDADFAAQRPELEKSLKKLVAGTDPFMVLRHSMERDMAEMLSNPQLAGAIEAMPKPAAP